MSSCSFLSTLMQALTPLLTATPLRKPTLPSLRLSSRSTLTSFPTSHDGTPTSPRGRLSTQTSKATRSRPLTS